jgi:hypothetical protein
LNMSDSGISLSCILQRVKRIRKMLEIPFLKKQDAGDQLLSKETSMLLHAGHSDTNEQASLSKDPECPTFPLEDEDTDGDDSHDDASKEGYPITKRSNSIEGHDDVPSATVVDENPWCFQCSEAHWENECPYNGDDHQQESPQINLTAEEQPKAIKSTKEDFDQIEWPTKEECYQLINSLKDMRIEPVKIQKISAAKSRPPPSIQHTRTIQGTTNFRVKEYQKGDTVGMWDANKGRPTTITKDNHFDFGPSRVRKKPVNDSYYLPTLEARRCPLPISGRLLETHPGGGA